VIVNSTAYVQIPPCKRERKEGGRREGAGGGERGGEESPEPGKAEHRTMRGIEKSSTSVGEAPSFASK